MRSVMFKLLEPIPAGVFTEVCYRLHFAAREVESIHVDPRDRQSVLAQVEGGGEDVIRKIRQAAARAIAEALAAKKPREAALLAFGRPARAPDPTRSLVETGQLIELSQGLCGIGDGLLVLVNELDRAALAFAASLGAEERHYPPVLPVSFFDRIGYLKLFPHALMFVKHLVKDSENIDGFSTHHRVEDGRLTGDGDYLSPTELVLQPATCFNVYREFEGRSLDRPTAVTCSGPCFRYEAGNAHGLERLWCFVLREIVFMGERDFVLSTRERCARWAVELASRYGLCGRLVSASDPFFMRAGDLGEQGLAPADVKWELRVDLPYREGSTAVGSFNVHGTFFSSRFSISGPRGALWTGCGGLGLERFALVIAAYRDAARAEVVDRG